MNQIKIERRTHPRAEGNLPLKICQEGLDVITETRNISCSGVYCRVNKPMPVMSKIGIILLLPIKVNGRKKVVTKKIKCNGVVVRSEPIIEPEAKQAMHNVAIFFSDLCKKDRDIIARYVLQCFAR